MFNHNQRQEDFKVTQKNLALKQAEHDLEMAMIAQDAIAEDASEEEKNFRTSKLDVKM